MFPIAAGGYVVILRRAVQAAAVARLRKGVEGDQQDPERGPE